MTLLTREQILATDDIVTEEIEIPEWGGSVRMKMMTGKERDAFETSLFKKKGKEQVYDSTNVRARLASQVCVDEEGKRIFTPADIEELGKKSAAALDRIFSKAQKMNRITDEDIEEMAGNSDTAHTD